MSAEPRKILLLINGVSSHPESYESSYIKQHLLPPYMTSCLQLYDTEINNSFKAHYWKLFLQNLVNAFNNEEEIPKLSILDAIKFITE
ncbi:12345_t:CDS:1, partial [Racocetra fulgida]